MTLIIILNAVFSAFVVVGIVGLHLYAIATDRSERTQREGAAIAAARPAVEPRLRNAGHRDREPRYGRVPASARA